MYMLMHYQLNIKFMDFNFLTTIYYINAKNVSLNTHASELKRVQFKFTQQYCYDYLRYENQLINQLTNSKL